MMYKYGNKANRKAQKKAQELIGTRGLVAIRPDGARLVGEFMGVADFRPLGGSRRSWRRAFENAGLYDPEQRKYSKI